VDVEGEDGVKLLDASQALVVPQQAEGDAGSLD